MHRCGLNEINQTRNELKETQLNRRVYTRDEELVSLSASKESIVYKRYLKDEYLLTTVMINVSHCNPKISGLSQKSGRV